MTRCQPKVGLKSKPRSDSSGSARPVARWLKKDGQTELRWLQQAVGPRSGFDVFVMGDATPLPVRRRADRLRAVAPFFDHAAAQRGHAAGPASAPDVALAHRPRQGAHSGAKAGVIDHPAQAQVGRAGEHPLVSRSGHLNYGDHSRAGGQFFVAAANGRQRRLITHQQLPVEVGWDVERAARPANHDGR